MSCSSVSYALGSEELGIELTKSVAAVEENFKHLRKIKSGDDEPTQP